MSPIATITGSSGSHSSPRACSSVASTARARCVVSNSSPTPLVLALWQSRSSAWLWVAARPDRCASAQRVVEVLPGAVVGPLIEVAGDAVAPHRTVLMLPRSEAVAGQAWMERCGTGWPPASSGSSG